MTRICWPFSWAHVASSDLGRLVLNKPETNPNPNCLVSPGTLFGLGQCWVPGLKCLVVPIQTRSSKSEPVPKSGYLDKASNVSFKHGGAHLQVWHGIEIR